MFHDTNALQKYGFAPSVTDSLEAESGDGRGEER